MGQRPTLLTGAILGAIVALGVSIIGSILVSALFNSYKDIWVKYVADFFRNLNGYVIEKFN